MLLAYQTKRASCDFLRHRPFASDCQRDADSQRSESTQAQRVPLHRPCAGGEPRIARKRYSHSNKGISGQLHRRSFGPNEISSKVRLLAHLYLGKFELRSEGIAFAPTSNSDCDVLRSTGWKSASCTKSRSAGLTFSDVDAAELGRQLSLSQVETPNLGKTQA